MGDGTRQAWLGIAACAAVAAAGAGCVSPSAVFSCDSSDQCTPGGTCQSTGFCSFPDTTCGSGQRYAESAGGGFGGQCVGADGPDAAGVVDAGPDGSATTDTDGDGVVDALDNCPSIDNTDQHDEDGVDGGDACDSCPQLAGPQGDPDGDGIGDACDPHPATGGDVLVRFEGFGTAPGFPDGWAVAPAGTEGSWIPVGDDLTYTAADAISRYYTVDAGGGGHLRVELGAAVQSSGGAAGILAPIFDADVAAQNFYACAPRIDAQVWAIQTCTAGGFASVITDNVPPPTLPDSYRSIGTIDGAGETCTFGATSGEHALAFAGASGGRTRVGVRARDLTAQIHYIAIYRSP